MPRGRVAKANTRVPAGRQTPKTALLEKLEAYKMALRDLLAIFDNYRQKTCWSPSDPDEIRLDQIRKMVRSEILERYGMNDE